MLEKFIWDNEKLLPSNMKNTIELLAPKDKKVKYQIYVKNKRDHIDFSECTIFGDCVASKYIDFISTVIIIFYPTVLFKRSYNGNHRMTIDYKLWYGTLYNLLAAMHMPKVDKSLKLNNSYAYLRHKLAANHAIRAIDDYSLKDFRIGQPEGKIDGLYGVLLDRAIKKSDSEILDMSRINHFRGLKCDGQITVKELQHCLWNMYNITISMYKLKRIVTDLGIDRHHVDTARRKHMFLNHGEMVRTKIHISKLIEQGKIKAEKQQEKI